MKKGTWGMGSWTPRTKWLTAAAFLAAGGWLFVFCAAEASNRLGESPQKTQERMSYQLQQVVVSAKLEKMKHRDTVTLNIEMVDESYQKVRTAHDAAVRSTKWTIDTSKLASKSLFGWTPKTVWRTNNLIYGDCLHVAEGSDSEVVMTLRTELGTGSGILTLNKADLSLRYEEDKSPQSLNVSIEGNYTDAKKMLKEMCKGKEVSIKQFSDYMTRDRAHTLLHGEEPRNHGPIIVTEPGACSEQDASEACTRLRTALKTVKCADIVPGILWRCPNSGDGKWDRVVRDHDGMFVAAGRSIEAFGPDIVGIDQDAMAAKTKLRGVNAERSQWVNGIYRYRQSKGIPIKISVDPGGRKVWAYVPKGDWSKEITWSFVCSPSEPQKGKFEFRKFGRVKWHKLKFFVMADDGTEQVAVGWRLSVPSWDGTRITLGKDGTTEGARILAQSPPERSPTDMLQLTVSPPLSEELIYEPVLLMVDQSRLCPIMVRPEPNELVLRLEPLPQTVTLSLKHFAGVAQKVILPNSERVGQIRLSDKETSIEVKALTEVEVTLGGKTVPLEKYHEFMVALKQQNRGERCAELRKLFPELYMGRTVIYAPDMANIPVRIQGRRPEAGFAKQIGGGFQTYNAPGSNVQILTNGFWEAMSTELGCSFEGIGPRSAYVIVDTGEFLHSQGELGKVEECDDDDVSPLQRALFKCDIGESVSTVSDPQMLEALWIRCHERLYRNLVAAGADQITIVQAHPHSKGDGEDIVFSNVAFVPLSFYDESSALKKLADAAYKLRRRAETAVRSRESRRAMSGVELARAHLKTLGSRDAGKDELPMHLVFSQPHSQRDGEVQTVDMEMAAQFWIVPGLLANSSCPLARLEPHEISEGED